MKSYNFPGQSLIVCPHFDDACFSVGGILAAGLFEDVVILTVFSKSKNVFNSKLLKPLLKAAKVTKSNMLEQVAIKAVSRKRANEDRLFCQKIQAHQVVMDFKDSPLRGEEIFFGIELNDVEKNVTYKPVVRAIERFLSLKFYNSILCPLAIGNHVDHLIVLRALLEVIKSSKSTSEVFFYEDLPYASAFKMEKVTSLARQRTQDNNSKLFDISKQENVKRKLLKIYGSQITNQGIDQIFFHARRLFTLISDEPNEIGYCERLWLKDEP
jgi:LmbE family N-acetylglucosaminyl deacetylase